MLVSFSLASIIFWSHLVTLIGFQKRVGGVGISGYCDFVRRKSVGERVSLADTLLPHSRCQNSRREISWWWAIAFVFGVAYNVISFSHIFKLSLVVSQQIVPLSLDTTHRRPSTVSGYSFVQLMRRRTWRQSLLKTKVCYNKTEDRLATGRKESEDHKLSANMKGVSLSV